MRVMKESIDRIPLQRSTIDISALRRALVMVINVMTTLQNTLRSDPVLPESKKQDKR